MTYAIIGYPSAAEQMAIRVELIYDSSHEWKVWSIPAAIAPHGRSEPRAHNSIINL
jgi:hypothetical protein